MQRFYSSLLFANLVLAAGRTTPPSGALVVGVDGSHSTVQDAVDALDTSSTSEQIIFIHPGTYAEQVYIQPLSGPLTVYGYTEDDGSYASNQVEITGSLSQVCKSRSSGVAACPDSSFFLGGRTRQRWHCYHAGVDDRLQSVQPQPGEHIW